jgi:hypothetical protein
MRHNTHIYLFAYVFSIAAFVSPAHKSFAQDASVPHDLLSKLYDCQKIEPLEAQNTCYNQAVTALQNAEKNNDILIMSKQSLQSIQEDVFGYKNIPLEKLTLAGGNPPQRITSISAPVKKVERYLSGYVVSLENNQVWEQYAGNIPRVPKGKLYANIKISPTGNYKMVLFTDKSRVSNIRVRRIQ